mgnify:CR=1 FL=1
MRVVIRAFTKDGYHRDVLVMSEKQVHMNDLRIEDPTGSNLSGLIGHGGRIITEKFPEVVYFEVVCELEKSERKS